MSDDAERYGPDIDSLYEEELRNLRAEGSSRKPPKPTGNLCAHCVPLMLSFPSGRRLAHSRLCPDKPGEKINVADYAQGRSWPPSRWRQG